MKIAVVSDDGVTVSQHFGRAQMYVVLTVEDGRIIAEENRPKLGHDAFAAQPHDDVDAQGRHGFGSSAQSPHEQMAAAIADCQALICGGMGWGARESLQQSGIEVVVTDVADVREAALRLAKGVLPNLAERLHEETGMGGKGGGEGRVAPSVVYGPVPSWRLGRSLGIDLLPGRGKTCCFDCVYCQLGITTDPRSDRAEFVSLDALARELRAAREVAADCVTFSGTGEPALAANPGPAIDLARSVSGLPVAILTNSALMTLPDVRSDLAKADIVVAKLDAPDQRLFRLINRPVGECSISDIISAIKRFRSDFTGKLALQMMFFKGNEAVARQMADIARHVEADEVQLNTPLRRCPVAPLSREEMDAIRDEFPGVKGVVTVYDRAPPDVKPVDAAETRRRRPGTSGNLTLSA